MPIASGVHYFASGADNHLRPAAFLIHGAGGNHLYWPPQIRRLDHQRIFAVDLPGHGQSSGIGQQRVEEYTRSVLALMDDLRVNAAVLIGHSMGGAVAIDAAIRKPGRVLGLGLIGTGARLRVDPVILQSASQERSVPAALKIIGERAFAQNAPARLKELALARMAEIRPSVLYGDLLACDAFDRMDRVGEIALPATIICGSEDQLAPPRYSRYLHESIRGSELQIIPGAGHMVMLEQPDQVAAQLTEFLDSILYVPGR